jgi:1,4-dihydroxy-2-naphthoyl-CoA hydrolase
MPGHGAAGTTHVWQIELRNDAGELTCVSRITMAILAPK